MTGFIILWLLIGVVVSGSTWYRVCLVDGHEKFYKDSHYEFGYSRKQTTVVMVIVYAVVTVIWFVMVPSIYRFFVNKYKG